MSMLLFIAGFFGAYMFTMLFVNLVPGGDTDLKAVLGIVLFISGEIAACTGIIVKKLDELKNKHIN